MQSIQIDKENNRLLIKIAGSVSLTEAKGISVMIMRKVTELQPGFIVVDDLTHFQLSSPQAGLCLQSVLRCFVEHKAAGVIRIIGASRMAILLFGKFSKLFQNQIPIQYIASHDDLPQAIEKIREHSQHM